MSDALRLEGLGRSFGGRPALAGVDLAVPRGSLTCLLGPSGCGKTTLLRLVGGYLAPDAGRVLLGGRDVTALPPERRGVGMVFQSYALFPHLSARDNVAFGLRVRRVARGARERRVDAMLERVGLSAADAGRRPRELSGGQQQRVALARALVVEPEVLLLDEPLANLDRRLRERLRDELKDLQRRTGVTTLLVTHDQEEALSLAGRVAVLAAGRLHQVGPPDEVYARPADAFVARFLGDANLLEVARCGSVLAGGFPLPAELGARPGQTVLARPEHVRVGRAAARVPGARRGRVTEVDFLGPDALLRLEVSGAPPLTARARAGETEPAPAPGDEVDVALEPGRLWPLPEAAVGV